MGEYEPRDSRNVTLKQQRAPGEPPRTGPREGETRQPQAQTELDEDGRGAEAEQTAASERQQQAEQRETAMQIDTDELATADRDRLGSND